MHERAVFVNLVRQIDAVARAEGGTPVRRITVRLGPQLRLTEQHFCEHFEWESRGTLAEGAAVTVERWRQADVPADAILLESIEVAVPERTPGS
jgi:hydrogenase nickel incorporation protein HypA/HybF